MIELLVVAAVGFAVLVVVGTLVAVASLVLLPFQMMGWAFKGLAMLLVLPILLVAGIVGAVIFGFGILLSLLPILPFLLLGWLIWRWIFPPRSAHAVR